MQKGSVMSVWSLFIFLFFLLLIFFDIGALSVSPIHYTRLISVDRLVALVNTDG